MIGRRLSLPRMRARQRTMVVSRPRATWAKLGLTWREATRSLVPAVRPSSPRGVAWPNWTSHVHLYVGLPAITTGGLPRGVLAPRAATAQLWRRIDTRLSTRLLLVRETAALEHHRLLRRVKHETARGVPPRREANWHEVVRHFRNGASPSSRIWSLLGAPSAALVPSLATPRPGPLPAWRRRHPATQSQPARDAALVLLRQPPLAELPIRAERAAVRPLRPTELVWCKAVDESSSAVAERSLNLLAASSPPPPNTARPSQSAPALEAIEALRPRLLDPALIDRVADDVISRVEKRIRIERERRGV